MKKILGAMRRCCEDFQMIEPGDRIAVGVSGGKDSLMLLYALRLYKMYMKIPFELQAITIGIGQPVPDYSPVARMCEELEIPYEFRPSDITDIIFNQRKEKNPCGLCAKMRRGALNEAAAELKCNKVALGHHMDDALETLMLSLLYEGRLHTLPPVTHLSRTNVTVIRPMLYIPEGDIASKVRKLGLPVITSSCPADGNTQRQEMKDLIAALVRRYPHAKRYMLHALQDSDQYGLWDKDKLLLPSLPHTTPENDTTDAGQGDSL